MIDMESASFTASAYPAIEAQLHVLLESGPTYGLTEGQAAYLAGIIDGEGTIGIYGNNPSNPGSYHVVLIINNTSEPLLDTLKGWIGGSKTRTGGGPPDPMHAQNWQLVLWQHRAAQVIRQCRPYLIIKAAQADLALEFIDTWVSWKGRGPVPAAEIERRSGYALRMRDLDQPGYAAGLRRWKGGRRRRQ